MRSINRKFLTFIMALAIIFSSFSPLVFAKETKPEYATKNQIAALVLKSADYYNTKVKKQDIIDSYKGSSTKDEKLATKAEALAMISSGFGKLPTPVGNNLRVGTFGEPFTDTPKWAQGNIDNLRNAGVLEEASKEILGSMDNITIDQVQKIISRIWSLYGTNPRDDFYSTANKKWLDSATIPTGYVGNGSFNEISQENTKRIKGIIKELHDKKFEVNSKEQKISDFYSSAIDNEGRNKQGIEPIKKYLKAFEDAKNIEELLNAEALLTKETGIITLLDFGVWADAKDSTVNTLHYGGMNIWPSGSKDQFVSNTDKFKNACIKVFTSLLVLSGQDEKSSRADAEKLYEMRRNISIESLNPQDYYDVTKTYNPYTMEEFSALYPGINMKKYMADMNLNKANKIIVIDVKSAKKVNEYFKEDNIELLKLQAKVELLNSSRRYLSTDFKKVIQEFNKDLYGIKEGKSDEDLAIDIVKSELADYLGQVYVEKYFSPEAKKDVENMVKNIIKTYEERIKKLDWMSDATKEMAIKKLSTLNVKIGYPDVWPKTLDEVKIKTFNDGGSLFTNIASINAAKSKKVIESLGQPVDKTSWGMDAYEVNAYYSPSYNEIVFPAGILQAPFYDLKAKPEENLGGIGVVIGHEISHAFDNNGALYDEKGNAKNWWTDSDLKKFEEKCQSVINFYDNIEIVPGVVNNGELTISENIADLGGVACSLNIMSKLKNPDYKAFFNNYAKAWKSTTTRESLEASKNNDVHSYDKVRVNRTIVNFSEFYKAFDVKPGDGMYITPENRVTIW